MKKKVLMLTLSLSVLFAGIVSAASLWGTYKGNPIIRVFLNGNPVFSNDVPAMSYNGRTMIPISMLKSMGLTYTWDQSTLTLDLKKSNDNTYNLKNYALMMDYYGALQGLGDLFWKSQAQLTSDLSYLRNSNTPQDILNHGNSVVTALVDEYNRLQKLEQSKLNISSSVGQNDSAIDQLLVGYYNAIDYYKKGLDNLYSYNTDSSYSDKFFDNLTAASKLIETSYNSAASGYTKYFNLIQNAVPSGGSIVNNPVIVQPNPVIVDTGTVNSKIDGDFEGFENGKIFKLLNGQIWQQTDYTYKYSYKFSPKVTIYKDGSKYKMIVDGVDKTVTVERLK